MWFVYIVQCADDTLYTGMTSDVQKRIRRHNHGRGAKYIIGKLPVQLVYSEQHETHLSAARREREIKRLRRAQKLLLIQGKTELVPSL
ncbi:MAG: GIY-YIG nuclease family protein [Candidatus Levybacteria bacterium]|nr:GIY-YIG nuclease family protein [Candidatus Levybacteria bacterium]